MDHVLQLTSNGQGPSPELENMSEGVFVSLTSAYQHRRRRQKLPSSPTVPCDNPQLFNK